MLPGVAAVVVRQLLLMVVVVVVPVNLQQVLVLLVVIQFQWLLLWVAADKVLHGMDLPLVQMERIVQSLILAVL
jgi:hypothetical protein